MSATAIVGANWGDEGKGRMVDAIAADHDVVVRYQGGANAGHTVIDARGKFVFRLLPSGVLHRHTLNILGPGVAIDPVVLDAELRVIGERTGAEPNLRISSRAQLVLEHHRALDACSEHRLAEAGIGSTRSGMAPHYADRYARRGITVDDLFDQAGLTQKLERSLFEANLLLQHGYGEAPRAASDVAAALAAHRDRLAPLVTDTTVVLNEAIRAGRRVLLEGQLGALRDPHHGIYPYVTSSSPLAGFAAVGAGVPPWAITRILAVTKAYSSCVGAGPFVVELDGESADQLRRRGGDAGEYGAVTGRPRRVGYFDAVATRYGCQVQGATELALTCLDVLGYLDEIPICTGYRLPDGITRDFPSTRLLAAAQPQYERLPGWRRPIGDIRRLADLPTEARRYVDRIQELVGVAVRWVSVSPRREGLIPL